MTIKLAGRRLLAGIVLASLLAVGWPAAVEEVRAETDAPTPVEIIQALKSGEHVIFMRHALSDTSTYDQVVPVGLEDCSAQRNLTKAGRLQAVDIGKAMRRLRIPIGEVLSSPYCRTKETAELAFGKSLANHGLLNTANLTDQEKAPILAELRILLGRPVPPDSNRVLVSHSSTLADSIGIFPKPEGVVIIFRPDGNGGFRHFATITPTEWEKFPALQR